MLVTFGTVYFIESMAYTYYKYIILQATHSF